MTRRVITAVAVVMVGAAATAYAAVTPIPPDQYPPGCDPNGVALQGDGADDSLSGTPRRDLLRGGQGEDALNGDQREDCLFGQRDRDSVDGGGDTDILDGGPGNDLVEGGGGGDVANGGPGRDVVEGGTGEDSIDGGRRPDRLDGGEGRDRMVDRTGRNEIDCGIGIDTVLTNRQSVVKKCEHVLTPGPEARVLDFACDYATCTTIFKRHGRHGRVKFRMRAESIKGHISVCVRLLGDGFPRGCRDGRLKQHGNHYSDVLDFFRRFTRISRKGALYQMYWQHGGRAHPLADHLHFRCSSNHRHCRSA